MTKRVLLAGLFHETHTFLAGRTTLPEFEERVGDQLWTAEQDGSPLAGALQVARDRKWQVIPVIDLRATPGPTAEDRVVERFWTAVEPAARAAVSDGLDGVYLVLHGAMVSESRSDVEGDIVARLRSLIGEKIPICGVLDLHGNISARMCASSNGLVAYRQNPHADAHAAALDGALLLDRLMTTGERAVTVWAQPPVMWPPTGTGTAFEPMRTLEAEARAIEARYPEILSVNVFGGFSFADTPDTGVSFTAVTVGNPEQAQRELNRLSDLAVRHREEGNVRDRPLEEVLSRLGEHREGPVVLAEPSDNIGGGAPGDGTAVLRAFVERNIQNAAVAINDPQAVAALLAKKCGEHVTIDIGGRENTLSGPPMRLDVELVSTSDGKFALEDRNSHLASMCGSHFDMRPCAVVRHRGIQILLTTHKTPPFDLAQWRSQGIIPEQLFVIAVKAAVAHRRVYDTIAKAHYTVETPGPCSGNLKTFPFRNVRRPIYPLDDIPAAGPAPVV